MNVYRSQKHYLCYSCMTLRLCIKNITILSYMTHSHPDHLTWLSGRGLREAFQRSDARRKKTWRTLSKPPHVNVAMEIILCIDDFPLKKTCRRLPIAMFDYQRVNLNLI